jgi:hypothetical protein
LNELSTIKGAELALLLGSWKLGFPSIEQQVVELINVHLVVDVDLRPIVCLDAGNTVLGSHEATDAPLHEPEQFLGVKEQD